MSSVHYLTNTYMSPADPVPPSSISTEPIAVAEIAPVKPKRQGLGASREIVETLLLAFVIFVAVRAVVLNFKVDGT